MNGIDIDRTLADWFRADAEAQVPADGLEHALEGARQRHPRPAWLARPGSHWDWAAPRAGSGVAVRALVAVAVVMLMAGGAIVVGARPFDPTPAPGASLGRLAYAVDGDIYVSDWHGSDPVRIADGLPGGKMGCGSAGYWAEGPMWSPDGRHLAYRSPRSQVTCDRPEADTIPTVLIADLFSPEGDRILFARDDHAGTSSIWSVSASGSEPQLLLSGIDWRTGDWQPLAADPGPSETHAPSSTEPRP